MVVVIPSCLDLPRHDFIIIIIIFFLISSSSCTSYLIVSSSTPVENPTQLVDDVCKNTTDYKFCVQAIYSDRRASTSDPYVLAYISFDLAYLNATHTSDYITSFLKNITAGGCGSSSQQSLVRGLNVCQSYYQKAVRSLAEAINDLDSETFDGLGGSAFDADHSAADCQATFSEGGGGGDSLDYSIFSLSLMNHNMRALAKICIVVSKLFTVS